MGPMVLVTYATRYGSTAEVAQAIAQEVNARGLDVRCQPIRTREELAPYCAVVLGAALYMGRLHKEARRFLMEHRSALSTIPVAVFVPGPVQANEKDWIGAEQQLAKELTNFPWFKPVACKIVGGKFDPSTLRFPLSLIPALRKMPASDVRDWSAIRAWAKDLGPRLSPVAFQGRAV
jgi:menaquinone-dependent protoporphyrinogen oxidase